MIRDTLRAMATRLLGVDEIRVDANGMTTWPGAVWQNHATGLGQSPNDPLQSFYPTGMTVLPSKTLETLFYGDATARRIVSKHAEEAFKRGVKAKYVGENAGSKENEKKMAKELANFKTSKRSKEAAIWGRTFGFGGVLIISDDGAADEPLREDEIKPGKPLNFAVIDKRDLTIADYQNDPDEDAWSEAETFRLQLSVSGVLSEGYDSGTIIHRSRIAMFPGALTAQRDRVQYFDGFDSSVLQYVWEVLRSFRSQHDSVATMLNTSSVGVLKIPDLWRVIVEGGLSKLIERLQLIQQQGSVSRIMPIAGDEEYNYVERTFASIPQLLEGEQALVAAAADMPITVLFGRSPAGQNSTGESDMDIWHDSVESMRANQYQDPVDKQIQLIARWIGDADPEGWIAEWPSLEIMNSKEEAELRKLTAETDEAYDRLGFPPETLLLHRFGGAEYNGTPPILTEEDTELMEALLSAPPPAPEPPPFAAPPNPPELPPGEDEDEPEDGKGELAA